MTAYWVSFVITSYSIHYTKLYDIPAGRTASYLEDVGNTSAASIPLALEQARAQGRLRPGGRVLLASFGAGFTWGATLYRW